MTKDRIVQAFTMLSLQRKVAFLISISYELTVWMRENVDESYSAESRIRHLLGANELQHHLSIEARHHLNNDLRRYPDETLFDMLIEKATHYEIDRALTASLIRVTERISHESN